MATYEYLCLACEHPFEERRPMTTGSVDIALACPSCGSGRIRRRFSFSTSIGATGSTASVRPTGGGCCGGGCACGN